MSGVKLRRGTCVAIKDYSTYLPHRHAREAAAARVVNWGEAQSLLPSESEMRSGYYGLVAQLGTVSDKYRDAIAKLLEGKQKIAVVANKQALGAFKQAHPTHAGVSSFQT